MRLPKAPAGGLLALVIPVSSSAPSTPHFHRAPSCSISVASGTRVDGSPPHPTACSLHAFQTHHNMRPCTILSVAVAISARPSCKVLKLSPEEAEWVRDAEREQAAREEERARVERQAAGERARQERAREEERAREAGA